MKRGLVHVTVMLGLLCAALFSRAQDYHWPLEAEPAVTSTFCEYRPGHFHSGIDLKTWGDVGLKVYAIDDGYVWRVKVSPWGGGRSVYLKLTQGSLAAYFHLSAFHPSIENVVGREQERVGRYSIDLFLRPGEIPVASGEVIGYSGESGIGGPHLHFELRDEENRPLNPLRHGFCVEDTIPPTVTKVSVSPVDLQSSVNGGHRTLILPVRKVRDGLFRVDQGVTITGCVGFGVCLYDRANAARNKVSVYRLDLSVDGELMFRTQYDSFPFERTRQVDLDRDFSVKRAGHGLFQRLYTVRGNDLPFYSEVVPGGHEGGQGARATPPCAWTSMPGWHAVRIVGADVNGNEAVVEMDVLVDQSPQILACDGRHEDGRLSLKAQAKDDDDEVRLVCFEYSTDFGAHWAVVAVDSANSPTGSYSAEVQKGPNEPCQVRARACDAFGVWSAPHICCVTEMEGAAYPGNRIVQWEPRFQNTFIEWTLTSDRPLVSTPRVTLFQPSNAPVSLRVNRLDEHSFAVLSTYEPDPRGQAVLVVEARDLGGAPCRTEIPCDAFRITREDGGVVVSEGAKVSASFEPGGVYWDLWARIDIDSVSELPVLPMRSDPYLMRPDDVPFDKGAQIAFRWGLDRGSAQRVGVYRFLEGGAWEYVGSERDTLSEIISADVYSFGMFALLEDTIPPRIWNLRPKQGSKIRTKGLRLFARIRDEGSGLGREGDLVMELDGRRMISEYDPEGAWLQYRVKDPLSVGFHRLSVSVTDLAGNTTTRESLFQVVQ
ncbi:MAG: M23 family metallopeptidase [Gemmatimonadota bacterium]|nr:MAG: M23 family metallopeptidase [Gemmatimonadota bacterium]